MKLGLRLHVDFQSPLMTCPSAPACPESAPAEAGFEARRTQLQLGTTFLRMIDSDLIIDFRGGGGTRIEHALLNFRPRQWMQVQLGLGKVPMGYEFFVVSSNHTDFIERSLLFTNINLQPFELGAALHGTFWNERVEYWVGLAQGKNAMARLSIVPGEGLFLAVSGAWGNRQELLGWTSATGVGHWVDHFLQVDGPHHRLGGELAAYQGPVSFKAEYGQRFDSLGEGLGAARRHGLYAAASWVLTGERKTARGVTPRSPLEPTGSWRGPGAWELATRYGQVWGTAPSGEKPDTLHRIHEVSLGLNWYLTTNVRWMLGLNGYQFEEDSMEAKRFLEVLARAQLAF